MNEDELEVRRADFEEVACAGLLTRRRYEDVRYGWYPTSSGTHSIQVEYGELLKMTARESLCEVRRMFREAGALPQDLLPPPARNGEKD